jgi:hypothetical protein
MILDIDPMSQPQFYTHEDFPELPVGTGFHKPPWPHTASVQNENGKWCLTIAAKKEDVDAWHSEHLPSRETFALAQQWHGQPDTVPRADYDALAIELGALMKWHRDQSNAAVVSIRHALARGDHTDATKWLAIRGVRRDEVRQLIGVLRRLRSATKTAAPDPLAARVSDLAASLLKQARLLNENGDTIDAQALQLLRLRAALLDMFQMMQDGILVRDTRHDGLLGAGLLLLDFVRRIKAARDAMGGAA